jgi:uncharacterized phage protein gp47/JayE
MSYTPPKLTELIKRAKGDFDAVGVRSLLIDAIAMAHAGQTNGLYEFLGWISRQIVPHLADEEILLLFCQFWGIQRKMPSKAKGSLILTVRGDTAITAGTQWQTSSGRVIECSQSKLLSAGIAAVEVVAIDEGATSNTSGGIEFELISPVVNVESKAVLSEMGMTGGADIESISSLRARLLFRVQYPPSGGNKWDYIRWARECAGVTRAWCIPAPLYCNYVTVVFVLDEQANILPSSDDLNRVREYINGHINPVTNQFEGKPPAAELIVKAPVLKAINPQIKLFPDTPETRTAVYNALVELLSKSQLGEKIYLSHIRAAVSNAKNVIDHQINLNTDIEALTDELIVLGGITWL